MIVVADTTPLNYLVLIGAIDVLPALYGTVVIPAAVFRELQAAKALPGVTVWIKSEPAWLTVKLVSNNE